jgi:hypothetical protein
MSDKPGGYVGQAVLERAVPGGRCVQRSEVLGQIGHDSPLRAVKIEDEDEGGGVIRGFGDTLKSDAAG